MSEEEKRFYCNALINIFVGPLILTEVAEWLCIFNICDLYRPYHCPLCELCMQSKRWNPPMMKMTKQLHFSMVTLSLALLLLSHKIKFTHNS